MFFYKHTALTGLKRSQPDKCCNETLPETLHIPHRIAPGSFNCMYDLDLGLLYIGERS